MNTENTENTRITYSIQSELYNKEYECLIILWFNGFGWDTDVEGSEDYYCLETAKIQALELKIQYPKIKIQIIKIETTSKIKYINI